MRKKLKKYHLFAWRAPKSKTDALSVATDSTV